MSPPGSVSKEIQQAYREANIYKYDRHEEQRHLDLKQYISQ